ncbi:hypothetical protein EI555_007417, partial [Monodon monoceros]
GCKARGSLHSANLPPPAIQTRSEAGGGELPAEAPARRPQRRAELRGRRPAALGSLVAARSSRLLPLPRRLKHRAAEARGRRRPPARALPAAPGFGSPAKAPSVSGAAEKLLPLGGLRLMRGGRGRPRVRGGRCNAEEAGYIIAWAHDCNYAGYIIAWAHYCNYVLKLTVDTRSQPFLQQALQAASASPKVSASLHIDSIAPDVV